MVPIMSGSRNECIKATATILTKLSSASIIIGVFVPFYAWLFDLPGLASAGVVALALSGAFWVVVGLILFMLAMRLLRELR